MQLVARRMKERMKERKSQIEAKEHLFSLEVTGLKGFVVFNDYVFIDINIF